MARSGKSPRKPDRFLIVISKQGEDPFVIDNTGHVLGGVVDIEISMQFGRQTIAKIVIETTDIQVTSGHPLELDAHDVTWEELFPGS